MGKTLTSTSRTVLQIWNLKSNEYNTLILQTDTNITYCLQKVQNMLQQEESAWPRNKNGKTLDVKQFEELEKLSPIYLRKHTFHYKKDI